MLMDLNAGGGGGGGGDHGPAFESAKRIVRTAMHDLELMIQTWQEQHAGQQLNPTDRGEGQNELGLYVSMLFTRECMERALNALGKMPPDAIALIVAAMVDKGNTRGEIDKYTVPEHRIGYGNRK